MTGTMSRECFEPGGFVYEFHGGKCRTLAPNVAYVQLGTGRCGNERKDVTWDEVMQQRREHQAERLERIRQPAKPAVLPCYVWTFFNRQDIPFHGWYCYVITRHDSIAVRGKHGDNETLRESIMTEIPCGLLLMPENFELWMATFARRHPRHKLIGDPRKAGAFHGWLKNESIFSIQRPTDL